MADVKYFKLGKIQQLQNNNVVFMNVVIEMKWYTRFFSDRKLINL